ncbi:twin-arginine translocation signal domain-containing protein [Streptosporangium carneum]|uniref:Uncharacterized protein n=1 Tax=Streptosporangium carneum TaxID=47481 RepID=A0A9W6IB19_9ACTN|nr:twin-arginine translocation signal domain-containing protein [Streptosporangium carneum]GLK14414.1 hypothetical protein GCM10017600_78260 [Streptosporangium carneum]
MRSVSRRSLLRGGALGVAAVTVAGCAEQEPRQAQRLAAEPPDPETMLIRQLIAGKERTVALYSSADSDRLTPFRQRHEAHLAELRRRLPRESGSASPASSAGAQADPSASPSGAATAGSQISVRDLRDMERKAAALRPRQLDGVSPALAQLIASIGACEAAHALALSRSL